MDTRTINDGYALIARELIDTDECLEYIRESNVTIVYLSSELEKKSKRKLVFGECEKVPDRYKWAVPCDFTITVFEPNVERFTGEQLRILIFHELLHIGIEKDGNEESYFVRPHDIEDFEEVLRRYGMRWADDAIGEVERAGSRYSDDDEEG